MSPLGVEPSKPSALQKEKYEGESFLPRRFLEVLWGLLEGHALGICSFAFEGGRALIPIMLLLRLRLWLCIADLRWTPLVEGIYCIVDLTEQKYKASLEEDQFQSALGARWCPSSLLRQSISWVCPSAFC